MHTLGLVIPLHYHSLNFTIMSSIDLDMLSSQIEYQLFWNHQYQHALYFKRKSIQSKNQCFSYPQSISPSHLTINPHYQESLNTNPTFNSQQTSTYCPYPNLDKGIQQSNNPIQVSTSYPSQPSTNQFQVSTSYPIPLLINLVQASMSYSSPSSTNPFPVPMSLPSPISTNPFQVTPSIHENSILVQSHIPFPKFEDTCQDENPKHDIIMSPSF